MLFSLFLECLTAYSVLRSTSTTYYPITDSILLISDRLIGNYGVHTWGAHRGIVRLGTWNPARAPVLEQCLAVLAVRAHRLGLRGLRSMKYVQSGHAQRIISFFHARASSHVQTCYTELVYMCFCLALSHQDVRGLNAVPADLAKQAAVKVFLCCYTEHDGFELPSRIATFSPLRMYVRVYLYVFRVEIKLSFCGLRILAHRQVSLGLPTSALPSISNSPILEASFTLQGCPDYGVPQSFRIG